MRQMVMEQIARVNVNVAGTPGYCLGYVDDGINAPARTANAKIAYTNEKNAGRIRTTTPPVGIWLIGFMAFTKGSLNYNGTIIPLSQLGHVFLFRYKGGGVYEIHDSEVHSGQRGIYRSLAEIKAWFGAYAPNYLGWSTACDGRTIAAKKENDMVSTTIANVLYRLYIGTDVSDWGKQNAIGKMTPEALKKHLEESDAYKRRIAAAKAGTLPAQEHLPSAIRSVYVAPGTPVLTELKPGKYEVK